MFVTGSYPGIVQKCSFAVKEIFPSSLEKPIKGKAVNDGICRY